MPVPCEFCMYMWCLSDLVAYTTCTCDNVPPVVCTSCLDKICGQKCRKTCLLPVDKLSKSLIHEGISLLSPKLSKDTDAYSLIYKNATYNRREGISLLSVWCCVLQKSREIEARGVEMDLSHEILSLQGPPPPFTPSTNPR